MDYPIVNSIQDLSVPAYKPDKKEAETVRLLLERIQQLKTYRSALKCNPYDTSPKARTIEDLWDFCDFVSLPHKYYHREMRGWEAQNSRPLVYSKIDTALAVMIEKNPEAQISARRDQFSKKSKVLEALYNLSWDKGHGKQQLIKLIQDAATYGFAVGREYHRFEVAEVDEIVKYDPYEFKHETEKQKVVRHDEAYFEVLPIRDVWLDNRARPYDEDSMRDWCWEATYDYSTFLKKFPFEKYPNAQFVSPNSGDESGSSSRDKAEYARTVDGPSVRLTFYENRENDAFLITDGIVLVYEGPLLNHELSCVPIFWRKRNNFTLCGVGLAELLENDQELLDKVANMTVNQIILAISGSGWYGGSGTVTERDMILEPKLKKLREVEKITFPKIPMPDPMVLNIVEDIRDEADDVSGVSKSLEGDQIGKTLGEAVLNREAGLRRMAIPLNNIEFGLDRHARLRLNNIQMIYSRPVESAVIRDSLGVILDEKLWQDYQEEKQRLGSNSTEFIQRFPEDDVTGVLFHNQYSEERLPFEKTKEGEVEPSGEDQFLEITPDMIRGQYDVKIKSLSMIPMSKALESMKALETFNLVAQLPYTDILKAQKRLLKMRDEDPDDWMIPDDQIAQTQQAAQEVTAQMPIPAESMEQGEMPTPAPEMPTGNPELAVPPQPLVPPTQLTAPGVYSGLSGEIANQFRI